MDKLMEVKETLKGFFDRDWTWSEKVLLIVDCILLGVVLGAIWSPKRYKSTVMGSYNSGNGCGNVPAETEEDGLTF